MKQKNDSVADEIVDEIARLTFNCLSASVANDAHLALEKKKMKIPGGALCKTVLIRSSVSNDFQDARAKDNGFIHLFLIDL